MNNSTTNHSSSEQTAIIIFDGVCYFCNNAVNFIIHRDPTSKFQFVPMQSDYGKDLATQYKIDNYGLDTLVLIKQGKVFIRSDAALEIAGDLTGGWRFLAIFKLVPKAIRDWGYRWFAKNRYRFFGKSDQCIIPSQEIQDRFKGLN